MTISRCIPDLRILQLANEFTSVLTEIERTGICIDIEALNKLEQEYITRQQEIVQELTVISAKVMGDTPVQLGSPRWASEFVFSRSIRNIPKWKQMFQIGEEYQYPKTYTAQVYKDILRNPRHIEVVSRTEQHKCTSCDGKGYVRKVKKDGTPYANAHKCKTCEGTGITYTNTDKVGGLRVVPQQDWVSANGWSTNKEILELIATDGNTKPLAKHACKLLMEYKAINTYLSSFVNGIRKGIVDGTGLLHPNFNTMVTRTGRLSSSNPNFQNQPRAKTFPIRKCIVSRWGSDGYIIDPDFSQLEFRCAVEQAGDRQGAIDIDDKIDKHQWTADIIECDRQDAKVHTFKPLYGGTSGTESQQRYYKEFLVRHSGIKRWQEELCNQAVADGYIDIPSGRRYLFPHATRNYRGGVQGATKIKNYPVQGFATADIVPIAVIELYYALRNSGIKAVIINTVHDSIVIDCHKNDVDKCLEICYSVLSQMKEHIKRRLDYDFIIPLDFEIKYGINWLELKEYKYDKRTSITSSRPN